MANKKDGLTIGGGVELTNGAYNALMIQWLKGETYELILSRRGNDVKLEALDVHYLLDTMQDDYFDKAAASVAVIMAENDNLLRGISDSLSNYIYDGLVDEWQSKQIRKGRSVSISNFKHEDVYCLWLAVKGLINPEVVHTVSECSKRMRVFIGKMQTFIISFAFGELQNQVCTGQVLNMGSNYEQYVRAGFSAFKSSLYV